MSKIQHLDRQNMMKSPDFSIPEPANIGLMNRINPIRWLFFAFVFWLYLDLDHKSAIFGDTPKKEQSSEKSGQKIAKEKVKNHLKNESSPYLLQHVYNPVDWYPWGNEAFAKAKKEKKLIFLSIGFSSCHWCHVMEKESFEDEEVAKILNQHFVCIKVDREERPEIDEVYMAALYAMDSHGGWPLSMFLTPTGEPIIGGTYWPKNDMKEGTRERRGFISILNLIIELKKTRWEELVKQANEIAKLTRQELTGMTNLKLLKKLDSAVIDQAIDALKTKMDYEYGGTGNPTNKFSGPKFPNCPMVEFIMQWNEQKKDKKVQAWLDTTLASWANGGIYDQIGGGFHRYSTERTWNVPHFEKMLYDNAQLLKIYAQVYARDPKPDYRFVCEDIIAFIQREMTSPEGGFYSALDADSGGENGVFYAWGLPEIQQLFTEDQRKFLKNIWPMDNPWVHPLSPAESKKEESKKDPPPAVYILARNKLLSQLAGGAHVSIGDYIKKWQFYRQKLLEQRNKRVHPDRDEKMITAWNALMIEALAIAGKELQEKRYVAQAEKSAEYLLKVMYPAPNQLYRIYHPGLTNRSATIPAYLDDYAYLISALLRLYGVTGKEKWLTKAQILTDEMIQTFMEKEKGGFYFSGKNHDSLFARLKPYADNALPSGNGMALQVLLQLAKFAKTEQERQKYLQLYSENLKPFSAGVSSNPELSPQIMLSLMTLKNLDKNSTILNNGDKKEILSTLSTPDVVEVKATVLKSKEENSKKKEAEVSEIDIRLVIKKPWHLYAHEVGLSSLEEGRTRLIIKKNGKEISAKIDYPEGKLYKNQIGDEYRIYEGEHHLKLKLPLAKEDRLEMILFIQACNEMSCLKPGKISIQLP